MNMKREYKVIRKYRGWSIALFDMDRMTMRTIVRDVCREKYALMICEFLNQMEMWSL